MRSYWSRVGLQSSITDVLIKRENGTQMYTQGIKDGVMLPQAMEHRRLLVNHQKLGEDSPLHPSEGASPADILMWTPDIHNSERLNFSCFKPPHLCYSVKAVLGN